MFFFINSRHTAHSHVDKIFNSCHAGEVPMVSYSIRHSNLNGKRFLHSKGCFYGQQGGDGRLPVHSDATFSNVHSPKIITLFQRFSTQTIESACDAMRRFHTSV